MKIDCGNVLAYTDELKMYCVKVSKCLRPYVFEKKNYTNKKYLKTRFLGKKVDKQIFLTPYYQIKQPTLVFV